MELLIGIGLVIYGGLLVYCNLKDTIDGEMSAVFFGIILFFVGIYMIDDFNDVAERNRIENDRKWELPNNNVSTIPFGSSSGFNGKYKCTSSGCDCTIKRSELEAYRLIRCSCGHITSWHHE